ncbi:Hypothetical predicted protein [Olea europaea subsp. europaea]|uniref:Uncharacterized protein n=1 Tax=Olea europaea subsp. europaea TaxID=158383 RepID=A0A8S0UN91_OLEEU|nr:Hypothetical predicted protein [Olea europaea subsp. europaea]
MHSPPSSTPHSPPFTVTLCSIFGDNRVEMFNQWLLLLLLVQNLCRKVISQSSSKDFLGKNNYTHCLCLSFYISVSSKMPK